MTIKKKKRMEQTRQSSTAVVAGQALAIIGLTIGKAFLVCLNEMAEFTDAMFMAHPAYRALCHSSKKNSVRMAIRRLEEQELIVEKASVPGTFMLTQKGRSRVKELIRRFGFLKDTSEENGMFAEPRVWDGKWRMLVFDIPEKRKDERRLLRYELYTSGFRRMQKSVWITPYQVNEAFVERLNGIGKLGGNIEFVVAESVSNERKYKKLFGLTDT